MPSSLLALSPLDGRYADITAPLKEYFSECSLIRYRVFVELEWFKYLILHEPFRNGKEAVTQEDLDYLTKCCFIDSNSAQVVKNIEAETKHDMKSVEYFIARNIMNGIKEKKLNASLLEFKELIHFCCTSEDINNLAYGLMFKSSIEHVLRPCLLSVIKEFGILAEKFKDTPMLSLTHGQPATPTTFGKEMGLFGSRLVQQLHLFDAIKFKGKFNGAVGNFNAHIAAFPNVNWQKVSYDFVTSLGLDYQPYSTQIEVHDYIAELCHVLLRMHVILINAAQDIWYYISRNCLKLNNNTTEIGSSTMPHKVNPIDFENAEGNFGLSNALLQFFATKLPISRMQRDLSDSTVLRNIGSSFGYSLVGLKSFLKGLHKIDVNTTMVNKELSNHWEVLAEPIQTLMRSEFIPDAYETLKQMTRGLIIDKETYYNLLPNLTKQLNNPESRNTLVNLNPSNYVGLAEFYAHSIAEEIANIK